LSVLIIGGKTGFGIGGKGVRMLGIDILGEGIG